MRVLPSPCYVISDAHLGFAHDDVERSLLAFLDELPQRAGSLLINGDLFEFWFEWRTVIPRHAYRVLAALTRLREAGLPIVMIAGNHDCWGGEVLREDVGLDYVVGPWEGTLGGWQARVEHGDGLREREDRRYRALRRVLRNRLAIRAFRALHPDWATSLAMNSSHASRTYGARDGGRGLQRVAEASLAERPSVELLIYGHSHVPALTRVSRRQVYANAGSWLGDRSFLRVTDERIELRKWDGSTDGVYLDAADHVTEEALPSLQEHQRIVGGDEAVRGLALRRLQLERLEDPRRCGRGLLRGVDETHGVAEHPLQQWFEQWVVRAAQHERIDAAVAKGLEILARDELGRFVLRPSFLDERHKEGTRTRGGTDLLVQLTNGAHVCARFDGAGGSDDADVSRTRGVHSGACAGLDDAEHRHGQFLAQRRERVRGRRVAGDDDHLDALLAQERRDLATVAPNGVGALRPVGHTGRVAEVQERLVWQLPDDLMRNGESTDARIEDADRSVIRHQNERLAPTRVP